MIDRSIWCAIPCRQIQRVNGIVTVLLEPVRYTSRELSIHKEFHATRGCTRLV